MISKWRELAGINSKTSNLLKRQEVFPPKWMAGTLSIFIVIAANPAKSRQKSRHRNTNENNGPAISRQMGFKPGFLPAILPSPLKGKAMEEP